MTCTLITDHLLVSPQCLEEQNQGHSFQNIKHVGLEPVAKQKQKQNIFILLSHQCL